ncbi:MAG: flagellar basal body P-ring biosynthesis protein FlgA [Syntrophorhabdaceae bacterium PtaU1.Bin034]|nr:MAG: flagellar basal body P-ring biosynthesis protein FlgA [Syntrophorhabdaceae bacterium PtaU1.Bin034]
MLRGKVRLSFFVVLFTITALLLPCGYSFAKVETDIVDFVKRFYQDDNIRVTFSNLPQYAREKTRTRGISFTKVPDASGDGICLVELDGRNGGVTNIYVPFKVFVKRKLYVLKHNIKKGDVLSADDVVEKQTYLNGSGAAYPMNSADVLGKVAKKELLAGNVITLKVLEDPTAIQKGEVVNITAQNRRLLVQGKGTALEKGKMGDVVRVKSTSGKEIAGKVTGSNTVSVEF